MRTFVARLRPGQAIVVDGGQYPNWLNGQSRVKKLLSGDLAFNQWFPRILRLKGGN